ncbi:MAG: phosphohydrolase [Deltaproteobacteria bacterium]|nr:phosphohydrolase [Deltaproteobacteria bacterium]
MPSDWIQTYTGQRFRPLEPEPSAIRIEDIAHSLSLLCRFNGHCRVFYSVAEHSVRVSHAVPPETALVGLLHDAAEAYLSDLPRPFKRWLPAFEEAEDHLLQVILEHFDEPWPLPDEVLRADDVLLATEMRDLMGEPPAPWGLRQEPLDEHIVALRSAEAKQAFIERFEALREIRGR